MHKIEKKYKVRKLTDRTELIKLEHSRIRAVTRFLYLAFVCPMLRGEKTEMFLCMKCLMIQDILFCKRVSSSLFLKQ